MMSIAHVDPPYTLAVRRELESGRLAAARALIEPVAPFERIRTTLNNGANVAAVKEALAFRGFDVGAVSLPSRPRLDDADRATVADILVGLTRGRTTGA